MFFSTSLSSSHLTLSIRVCVPICLPHNLSFSFRFYLISLSAATAIPFYLMTQNPGNVCKQLEEKIHAASDRLEQIVKQIPVEET